MWIFKYTFPSKLNITFSFSVYSNIFEGNMFEILIQEVLIRLGTTYIYIDARNLAYAVHSWFRYRYPCYRNASCKRAKRITRNSKRNKQIEKLILNQAAHFTCSSNTISTYQTQTDLGIYLRISILQLYIFDYQTFRMAKKTSFHIHVYRKMSSVSFYMK